MTRMICRTTPALAAFLGILLSGCVVIPVSSPRGPTPGPAPASATCARPHEAAAAEARVLAQVNGLRAARGLGRLSPSSRLRQVAQAHACDNAARGSYSHTGSDGATLQTRLHRYGYAPRRAAENTGYGFENDPDRLVAFWMNSPGHRANLLDPRVTEAALGLAQGARSAWVLELAVPR
ncbi:CAP domain-containing protein [Gemmobacter lutimaris]|uniref:CAP domain-containing protein n=2 Tax=Gemmobacter lutimaris TaxID=2306023 RepID=A0A398BP12_9RHOB|nr:CAP domain-containing protein [Gemmobacter lutimaris]